MAGKFQMKEMDLVELYQLLDMYRKVYVPKENDPKLSEVLENLGEQYKETSGGMEISEARNPRKAGRKRGYTQEQDKKILEEHLAGASIRETARRCGCSAGHVQDVLRRNI